MGYPDRSRIRVLTFAEMLSSIVGPIGSKVYVTDIGEYGAEYISNGTIWTHSGEIEIIQKAKGWLVPSLAAANAATYSQTGTTITVNSTAHNIPDVFYNTKNVYLEMGTAATGATIQPGWFSNFTYVNADSFTCESTISQTGTGTVNTNLAKIDIPDLTCTIPGSSMGTNGVITYSLLTSTAGGGTDNNWTYVNFGGVDFYIRGSVSNVVDNPKNYTIANRNTFISQAGSALTDSPASIVLGSIDTTLDQDVVFSLKMDGANNYLAIHSASVYMNPS